MDFLQALIVALIAALAPTVMMLASLLAILRMGRDVKAVHLAMNSMKDQLVKVTGESEFAKGLLKGKGEAK